MNLFPVSASDKFTNVINKSGKLNKITRHVVLYLLADQFDIYRKSTGKPGHYSRDIYKKTDGEYHLNEKDKLKYENPNIPATAIKYHINSIEIYSMTPLDKNQLNDIENLINSIKIR